MDEANTAPTTKWAFLVLQGMAWPVYIFSNLNI